MEHFKKPYLLVGNELRDVRWPLDQLPQPVNVFLLQILTVEGFLFNYRIGKGSLQVQTANTDLIVVRVLQKLFKLLSILEIFFRCHFVFVKEKSDWTEMWNTTEDNSGKQWRWIFKKPKIWFDDVGVCLSFTDNVRLAKKPAQRFTVKTNDHRLITFSPALQIDIRTITVKDTNGHVFAAISVYKSIITTNFAPKPCFLQIHNQPIRESG